MTDVKKEASPSESCVSCPSQQEITPLEEFLKDKKDKEDKKKKEEEEEATDVMLNVMDRIDEIYYKESRYRNLKEVDNEHNKVCINDLNLNLISDYLNVNISVFHKKCTILLIGNTQSGKSSFINWICENYSQNTSCLQKKNQITYVDVKNNYKYNLKNLSNTNYQLGMVNQSQNIMGNENMYGASYRAHYKKLHENKNILIPGDQCSFLYKPFEKIKKGADFINKYIRAKVCIQNNFIKYMNRINSVSFIDTTGINDTPDNEYDEIIMNLSAYVDLIFIFIDSTKYAINDRLLRIINYVMDYQINKVTICLTRIDLVKKVYLYRVVFYLTQYFLKNLNVFRIDILKNYEYYQRNMDSNEMIENEKEEGNNNYNDKYPDPQKKGKTNEQNQWNDVDDMGLKKQKTFSDAIFKKSITTFKNVMLFPKLLKKVINQDSFKKAFSLTNENKQISNVLNKFSSKEKKNDKQTRKSISNINKHTKQGVRSFLSFSKKNNNVEEETENDQEEEEEEEDEEEEEEGFGGGLLKKIMTKRFSSFKEKILEDDIMKRLNKSNSIDNNKKERVGVYSKKVEDEESDEEEESNEEEESDEEEENEEENEEDEEDETLEESDEPEDDNETETETETETDNETENEQKSDNSFQKKQICRSNTNAIITDNKKRKRKTLTTTTTTTKSEKKKRTLSRKNMERGNRSYNRFEKKKKKKAVKKKKKKKKKTWKSIRYVDCIKNTCVFILVLVYGIARSTYNIVYRLIKGYFGEDIKSPIEETDLKIEEKEIITKHTDAATSSHEILEFLTIYLPDIPRDTFKIEKWKFEADNKHVIHKRKRRYSCNVQQTHKPNTDNVFVSDVNENKRNFHRRSIPMELLLGNHGNKSQRKKRKHVSSPFLRRRRRSERNTDSAKEEEEEDVKAEKEIHQKSDHKFVPINSARLQSSKGKIGFENSDNVGRHPFAPNKTKIAYRRSLQPAGTIYQNNNYDNTFDPNIGKGGRHSIAHIEKSSKRFINDNKKKHRRHSYMHNRIEQTYKNESSRESSNESNNDINNDNDNDCNDNNNKDKMNMNFEKPIAADYEYNSPNRIRNNEVSDINMIQELLFKIDESIDFKTNQSIYLLKKDLENIRQICLKRISDNNEIVKKNKSLRIQKIKLYLAKYTAIFLGFLISLFRYDILVYFNFINPDLIFSIFSKYFLFLSSYNKNSLFIMANIILVVGYSFLYFRYKQRNYFKSLDKSDLNKLKIIMLFTQIVFDEINQLHMKLMGKKTK